MGQRVRGQECLPSPPPDSARSLLLYPHHLVLPPVLARLSLSQWETVLSLSLPGTAKSDKASGPPQGLAWLPPASQEAVASQAAPGGPKIGSALQQLTLTAWPAPPLSARGSRAPLSTPAPGAVPHFLCPAAATAGPGHFPHVSTAKATCSHKPRCEIDPWGGGVLSYFTDLKSECCIRFRDILLVSL